MKARSSVRQRRAEQPLLDAIGEPLRIELLLQLSMAFFIECRHELSLGY